ncbi:uncharacterized protein LOC135151558 [Daucus carota subsp. sativus]|uniref:uncharacterized protein LOC135151558 n=1 Tax=Daucus carota subsp. sativus TaxID=79200 RepID=UPI003083B565
MGVDGTHLKGDYGGVLLSAVALDANNEIFPLAYAIVSAKDKETWSWFFWNLYNLLKESSRKDRTRKLGHGFSGISTTFSKNQGIDITLLDVWPIVKRRYRCRHISRNYKKQFSGPLLYILFWRACNATSQFTYRKAMERLKEVGGDSVMKFFAELGDPAGWSKHKFDPNVCNDSNTSNFVESFNSTLGIDRCRPVLTLLEGIRRVCMVRIATRSQAAMTWKDDDLCPKIKKVLKAISKDTISCKAYMSSPGEYEIHEGKSHFPLSLNNKICSCGAWQISGIPCRHAIRAMVHAKIDPHNVVSAWYSVRTYKLSYSFSINPIPDQSQWPAYDDLPIVMPHAMKRGVRRPSRNRRREERENQKGKRATIQKLAREV